jgi:peptide/nickel transport system permease protein
MAARGKYSAELLGGAVPGVRGARDVWAPLRTMGTFARAKPLGAVGAVITLLFAVMAIAAPLLVTHDPLQTTLDVLVRPSRDHLFGTDRVGRDVYSRVVEGARVSITVGLVSVLLSTLGGSAIGLAAGYWGRILDTVSMRLMDVFMAFPSLILALVIMAVLGPSLRNVICVIAITQIPAISRVIRSQVLVVREQQYVEAARTLGAGHVRLVLAHVLPNVIPVIITYATTSLGYAILTEGTLSFLGVGVPPPTPSWGEMLSGDARLFLATAPWIAFFPIAALSLAILGASLLGDALRDVLDPRLRGSH